MGDGSGSPGGAGHDSLVASLRRDCGETGRLIAERDWSDSPLGPIRGWPQSLRTALGLLLRSPVPMVLLWGEDGLMLYNDAYSAFAGGRHPRLLGSKVREGWPEVADFNDNVMRVGLGGGTLSYKDQELTLYRHGQPEQVWMDLNYSPVPDETGQPAGVIAIVVETTAQVQSQRERDVTLRALGASESNYRYAVDLSPQTVWTSGPDGLLDHVGQRWQDWTGSTGLGTSWGDVLHPDDLQPSIDAWTRSITTGVPYDIWHRARMRDGGYRWMHSRAYPRRDEKGAIVRWYGTTEDVDDARRAEDARRETEARLRLIVDNATDYAIFTMDAERRVTTWSAGAAAIFGWSAEEMIGHSGDVIFTPEDFADGVPAREAEEALTTGCALDERWHVRKDGSRVFMDGSARCLPGATPSDAPSIMKIARDDTERRRAQDAIAESESRFRNMADHAPVMMWVTDETGYCTYLNKRWYEFTGQSEAEAQGYGWLDATHPEDKPVADEAFRSANAAQAPFRVEYRLRRADGTYRWALDAASPRFDAEGNYLGYVGSVIDIDERREMERALQELNATLEERVAERTQERDRLWTLSQDMLARGDYAGGMSAVNPAWTRILGWSEHKLLTDPYADIIHPDNVGTVIAALQEMRRTGQPTRFENRILTAHGEWKPIGWTVAPEPDGVNFIAVGRDLSDDKARQAELEAAQDALRQSQKMEAVGQLTGGIAHDFNNLLTGIVGSLELIQRRVGEGRYDALEKYANVAMTSAQRAAALTQRLLAFSRRQPLDPRTVDANRLVASMEDLLRRTLGPQIDLEMVLSGGLWATLCDPNQLESAILNLAINARDAMPDGGRLTVETANAHLDEAYARKQGDGVQPGQYVAVSVTDTGTGIPADVAQRIFEPFFTTKPIGQGTGLGLSQLYGFVKQSGGHVALYSEPGQGTTFRLYLPRHRGGLASQEDEAGARTAPVQAQGDGECVLVVEDESAVRMLITEALDELGYSSIEAVDGPSGLQQLENPRKIDLLVTDVGLPGLNGRQLADAARAIRPELKVLFITGFAGNAAVGNGLLEPGMEMMTKPFAMDQLAAKIRAMIEG